MGHVGHFRGLPQAGGPFNRGQTVVIQSRRGVELGDLLIVFDGGILTDSFHVFGPQESDNCRGIGKTGEPRVLRAAGSKDLARAHQMNTLRRDRFAHCQRVLEEQGWPWEILDVEPLLDGHSTVLHYLGPQKLETLSLRTRLRADCGFDVVLQPFGSEADRIKLEAHHAQCGCVSGCGSAGCSFGGSRGVDALSDASLSCASFETGMDGMEHHSLKSCESCGIRQLIATRRR